MGSSPIANRTNSINKGQHRQGRSIYIREKFLPDELTESILQKQRLRISKANQTEQNFHTATKHFGAASQQKSTTISTLGQNVTFASPKQSIVELKTNDGRKEVSPPLATY